MGKVVLTGQVSFTNQQINTIIPNEKVVPEYLYYSLSTRREELKNWAAVGTRTPILNKSAFEEVEIPLPPLETQRRIAAVLSAYDDLIENNTRRINALEQAAHDLCREWFVEFRFPGHADVPLVASGTDYGDIPQGWEVVKLPKIAKINAESIRKGEELEVILYINISAVSTGSIDALEEISFEDAPSRARRIVHHGDTIWSTLRPNRRSYALVINPSYNWVASTGFAVLTPKSVPFTYLYQAVTTDWFAGYLENNATGSAYPAVNTGDVKSADILCSPDDVLSKFHGIVEDMVLESEVLRNKNDVLRETRDLLLPRLVSGSLAVSDVELP
jgi:type I restriction enzyme, S subunit